MPTSLRESPNPEPGNAQAGFAPAARVTSLAEAGYLASVLEGEGIDAAVLPTKRLC